MPTETKNNYKQDDKKRYNTGFAKIDKVIRRTAKEHNFEAALNKHQAIKYWQQIVAVFLEEAATLSKAIDFKQGRLTVACLSRELANKLYVFSQQIITALNEAIGRKVVYAISIEC
jgi:hypothetical protein